MTKINDRHCPDCKEQLKRSRYEDIVEIDQCKKCNGIWLDEGELSVIQDTKNNHYDDIIKKMNEIGYQFERTEEPCQTERSCPCCQQILIKKEYGYHSNIIVDICVNCQGLWLDQGEIKALEIYIERIRGQFDDKGSDTDLKLGFLSRLKALFN